MDKISFTLIEPILASVLTGAAGVGAGYAHGKLSKKKFGKNTSLALSPLVPATGFAALMGPLGNWDYSASRLKRSAHNASVGAVVAAPLAGAAAGYFLGRKLAEKGNKMNKQAMLDEIRQEAFIKEAESLTGKDYGQAIRGTAAGGALIGSLSLAHKAGQHSAMRHVLSKVKTIPHDMQRTLLRGHAVRGIKRAGKAALIGAGAVGALNVAGLAMRAHRKPQMSQA